MKRISYIFAVLAVGLLVTAGPAAAGHKTDHQKPPACTGSQPGAKNKHCYPPAPSSTTTEGKKATLAASAGGQNEGGGFTVGMAVAGAGGALGTSLLLRRRWARKPAPKA